MDPDVTGSCWGLLGAEGPERSRTRRRMVSAPSMEKTRRPAVFSIEDRTQKAVSSHERAGPSVCRSSRTAAAAARGDQTIMISIMMRLATSALRLRVIAIRAASSAAGAVFTETRSFSTEHSLHRWSGRVFSRTTGRATNHRCSAKPRNHRFTVLPPCYELTILSSQAAACEVNREV